MLDAEVYMKSSRESEQEGISVIGIGQLRSDTCHYIDRVASGETFDIVWRRRSVARLSAFEPSRGRYTVAVPLDVLRTRASRLMIRVTAGETLTIEHRGRVVATLSAHQREDPGRPRRSNPEFRPTDFSETAVP